MLTWLMSRIQHFDPDVLVGHELHGVGIEVKAPAMPLLLLCEAF